MKLKEATAAGSDGFTAKIFKHVIEHIIDPLTYIYNLSLKNGIFPEIWKLAVIKPLFKTGDKLNTHNYRPISMISNFSKVLEKIVKTRVITYLEKINYCPIISLALGQIWELKMLYIVQQNILTRPLMMEKSL